MDGLTAGEVPDLEPAGEPRRDDDGVPIGLAHRRQEPLLADEAAAYAKAGLAQPPTERYGLTTARA